jgi:hypothetical protein
LDIIDMRTATFGQRDNMVWRKRQTITTAKAPMLVVGAQVTPLLRRVASAIAFLPRAPRLVVSFSNFGIPGSPLFVVSENLLSFFIVSSFALRGDTGLISRLPIICRLAVPFGVRGPRRAFFGAHLFIVLRAIFKAVLLLAASALFQLRLIPRGVELGVRRDACCFGCLARRTALGASAAVAFDIGRANLLRIGRAILRSLSESRFLIREIMSTVAGAAPRVPTVLSQFVRREVCEQFWFATASAFLRWGGFNHHLSLTNNWKAVPRKRQFN